MAVARCWLWQQASRMAQAARTIRRPCSWVPQTGAGAAMSEKCSWGSSRSDRCCLFPCHAASLSKGCLPRLHSVCVYGGGGVGRLKKAAKFWQLSLPSSTKLSQQGVLSTDSAFSQEEYHVPPEARSCQLIWAPSHRVHHVVPWLGAPS